MPQMRRFGKQRIVMFGICTAIEGGMPARVWQCHAQQIFK